jgi:hypothetical protein
MYSRSHSRSAMWVELKRQTAKLPEREREKCIRLFFSPFHFLMWAKQKTYPSWCINSASHCYGTSPGTRPPRPSPRWAPVWTRACPRGVGQRLRGRRPVCKRGRDAIIECMLVNEMVVCNKPGRENDDVSLEG